MSFESLSENCASFETKTRNYKMDFSFVSEHWKFWDQKPNSATFERGGGGEEGFTPKQIDNSYPNKQIVHSDCEYTTTQSGNLKAHSQKHTGDIGATN